MITSIAPAQFRVRDAIALPGAGDALIGRAASATAYPVHVTASRAEALAHVAALTGGADVALLTDHTVEALYGGELVRSLRTAGSAVIARAIPPGEASKSLEEAIRLWRWLAGSGIGRRDLLVTLGGGVVNDLGGWVASGYMRGIPYVNVPTTLLGMVDGALGGKVGVNHPVAKNLLGGFYQPAGVVADVSYLRSLPPRQLRAGLAECIKKAMIASPAYLDFLERDLDALLGRDAGALQALVRAAATIKTALIERDPYEADLRRPLNFGHTIGHPLETVTGYSPLLHGEAVAFGMVVESVIARERGLLAADTFERLVALLRSAGLPTRARELPAHAAAGAVIAALAKVRMIRAGSLRFVLPVAPGETVIADDVGEDEVRAALHACGLE